MEISDVEVRWASEACAVVAYREKQTQGEAVTIRLSTAVLVADANRPDPQWLHLQETWMDASAIAGMGRSEMAAGGERP